MTKNCKHVLGHCNYENMLEPTGTMYGLQCTKCNKYLMLISKVVYTEPETYKKIFTYLRENRLADRLAQR